MSKWKCSKSAERVTYYEHFPRSPVPHQKPGAVEPEEHADDVVDDLNEACADLEGDRRI